MNTTRKYIVFVEMVALLCAVGILFLTLSINRKVEPVLGSVTVGNEYNATSTVTIPSTGGRLLKTGPSVLGSVVVASTSATTFKVWNATSTTDIASTTPVQFVASPANGTYTFDVSFERGIIVELPAGFNGAYTVTYR